MNADRCVKLMYVHAFDMNKLDQLPIPGKCFLVFFYSSRQKSLIMIPEYTAGIVKFLYVFRETWKNLPPSWVSRFPSWTRKPQSSRVVWLGLHSMCCMFSIHWMSKGFSSSSYKNPRKPAVYNISIRIQQRKSCKKKRSKSASNLGKGWLVPTVMDNDI